MQPQVQFLYLIVSALSASFSPAQADAGPYPALEAADLDEPRFVEGVIEDADLITTSNDFGIRIDRVTFHGDDAEISLATNGRFSDLELRLSNQFVRDNPGEIGDVAQWLDTQLADGDRLYRTLDQWTFEGKLFDVSPAELARVPEDGLGISGTLPLEVGIARMEDTLDVTEQPPTQLVEQREGLVIDLSVSDDLFEVDWDVMIDDLNQKARS
ncbi:MAG: hypothetical protein ACQEVA_00690 [Myxococcota bacterium]